jgi:hypothetical protein
MDTVFSVTFLAAAGLILAAVLFSMFPDCEAGQVAVRTVWGTGACVYEAP